MRWCELGHGFGDLPTPVAGTHVIVPRTDPERTDADRFRKFAARSRPRYSGVLSYDQITGRLPVDLSSTTLLSFLAVTGSCPKTFASYR
jgi:hypothetical protein